MRYMAQYNPSTALMGVRDNLAFSLESEFDSQGGPWLRIRHVYKILRQMTNWMVNVYRYGEAEIVLSKDGTKIGAGRLLADGYPSNAAIAIMDYMLIDEAPS